VDSVSLREAQREVEQLSGEIESLVLDKEGLLVEREELEER
jgi:hypothetical protein